MKAAMESFKEAQMNRWANYDYELENERSMNEVLHRKVEELHRKQSQQNQNQNSQSSPATKQPEAAKAQALTRSSS